MVLRLENFKMPAVAMERLQLSAIIYNTSNGDARRLYYWHEMKCKRSMTYTIILISKY
jgi:hypothetical protein